MTKRTIVVITPGLKGGSWTRLRDLIRRSPEHCRFVVVGFGQAPAGMPGNCRIIGIPWFEYSTKTFLPYHPFFSVLFSLPLGLVAYVLALWYRPRVFLCNGMITGFYMLPWKALTRCRLVVSYHGWTEHNIHGLAEQLTIFLGKKLDLIVTNSAGSYKDICRLIPQSLVAISEHYADPVYFEAEDPPARTVRGQDLSRAYVVAYAGRILEETNVGALIRAIPRILTDDPRAAFLFCGEGTELIDVLRQYERQYPGRVHYLGYVGDRLELARLYRIADVVWSCGDDTYLTRPAVEALASGRPILIPDRPNVTLKKANMDIRVPTALVPDSIGRLVETDSEDAAHQIVLQLCRGDIHFDPQRIRAYARERYTIGNLDNMLAALHAD